MPLAPQVAVLTWLVVARQHVGDRFRDERGDTYSGVLWVAVGVAIAVTVGGILYKVFVDKANSISTTTPTPVSTP